MSFMDKPLFSQIMSFFQKLFLQINYLLLLALAEDILKLRPLNLISLSSLALSACSSEEKVTKPKPLDSPSFKGMYTSSGKKSC